MARKDLMYKIWQIAKDCAFWLHLEPDCVPSGTKGKRSRPQIGSEGIIKKKLMQNETSWKEVKNGKVWSFGQADVKEEGAQLFWSLAV